MPKLKTKSGVKKRFKLTATGKIKHGAVGKRHQLISHNAKYIRQNRGTDVLAEPDAKRIKLWIPYGLDLAETEKWHALKAASPRTPVTRQF